LFEFCEAKARTVSRAHGIFPSGKISGSQIPLEATNKVEYEYEYTSKSRDS